MPPPVVLEVSDGVGRKRTLTRLIGMRLRLLALWREVTGGHTESLILMAVIAITGDRLVRQEVSPELRDMSNPVPRALLGKCTISGIAEATGLNRETARRAIGRLIQRGVLERCADGSIHFTPGRMQSDNARRISRMQLEEFTRTANALLREGVLRLDP